MRFSLTKNQLGASLIEVLVSLVILLVALFGLAGLQAQGQRSEMESYQRVQAMVLLQDMAGRINANRKVATCYAFTTNPTAGTPYLGTAATATPPACTVGVASENAQVATDLAAWSTALSGAAEVNGGGGKVGAMIGARGCISYDSTTELINPKTATVIAGTGIYTLSVAWQGLAATATSTPNCGKGLYGTNDALRRTASLTMRMGSLL